VELTQSGAFAGAIDMELVYDKDTKRRNKRRRKICPNSWNKNHICPEKDQPDVFVLDGTRDPNKNALKPNKISSRLQHQKGLNGKNNYLIADDYDSTGALSPSGLMYTCDEFPFARQVAPKHIT
jgi:hypothetical protein